MDMAYTVSAASEIRLGVTDAVEAVLQNVSMILRTRQGSVPMYRRFGLPQAFLDRPAAAAAPIALAEIKEAVEEFEPRASVLGVTFETDNSGRMIPIVEVDIIE